VTPLDGVPDVVFGLELVLLTEHDPQSAHESLLETRSGPRQALAMGREVPLPKRLPEELNHTF
jgi:hypothetical protein